jgi:hypothetical protein
MSGDHNMYQKPHSYLDFECPRCGHCCQTENLELQKVVIKNLLSIMNDNSYIARDRLKAAELLTNTTFFRNDHD